MTADTRPLQEAEYRATDNDAHLTFGTYAPNAVQRGLIAAAQRSFLRRGVFRKALARLILGVTGKPVDVTFRDCAYRLRDRNNLIEYGILLNPAYNATDIDFLLDGMAAGDTFVDIGSNVGLYALPLAKRAGQTGRVVAVDVNPLMAGRLAWNAQASKLDNVAMVNCALSDRPGRARLTIRKGDVAIVAVVEDPDGDLPVRTLDSVLREAGVTAISGLKIDIEGHEDRVLAPYLAEAPSERLPQRIVIEKAGHDEDYPACTEAFARRGYRLCARTRVNSLYRLAA